MKLIREMLTHIALIGLVVLLIINVNDTAYFYRTLAMIGLVLLAMAVDEIVKIRKAVEAERERKATVYNMNVSYPRRSA